LFVRRKFAIAVHWAHLRAMSAGDLPLVDLPFVPPANDPDVESERIVAALSESLRRLRAGQPLDARRRLISA
jgi:hypothetical protein